MLSGSSPSGPKSMMSRLLVSLTDEQAHAAFTLVGFIGARGKWSGPALHGLLGEWIESGMPAGVALEEWLKEEVMGGGSLHGGRLDRARSRADVWNTKGARMATWAAPGLTALPEAGPRCPRVLFALGGEARADRFRAAVFNSRKPRLVLPGERWLEALRGSLPAIRGSGMGLLSSVGTMSYDLATVWALHAAIPLVLVAPMAMEEASREGAPELLRELLASGGCVNTCLLKAMGCPKGTHMVCRDRLLAMLADEHWIIELREGGNLFSLLKREQAVRPRPVRIVMPEAPGPPPERTCGLTKTFPHGTTMVAPDVRVLPPASIRWEEYLYHCTRACPGPWPGQGERDFLLGLLRNDPLSGHTALDTLIRILSEGVLRASARLIRGDHPTVSWTAVPPPELETIRRWRPALIRWTFEPYGFAVKRKVLHRMGARPAVYAPSEAFGRLRSRDLFRFQRHEPPRCLWKGEREWRLPTDLALEDLAPDEAFVFMRGREDVRRLRDFVHLSLPVVVLADV